MSPETKLARSSKIGWLLLALIVGLAVTLVLSAVSSGDADAKKKKPWERRSVGFALNADKLDGLDSSAFLPASRFGGTSAPDNPSGGGRIECYLSEVRLLAGVNVNPAEWHLADGTELSISRYTALFSLIGTTYGGNGQTTFALPDMRGLEPEGVRYFVCIEGIFP